MNIKEVAEKAGVSITTVSRVLNNPEMVSEKTKNKVLTVMDQLNYTPNWFARHLQKSRTNVIGMLIPDTLEQSYMEITKGVEKYRAAEKLQHHTLQHRIRSRHGGGLYHHTDGAKHRWTDPHLSFH